MARSLQFAVVSLTPGFLVGGTAFGYAAVSAHLLANCDYKLSCNGGVWLGAFLGGATFVLSSIGLGIGCYVHRTALRTFAAKHVAFAVAMLTAVVAVLLLTMPYWTYSLPASILAWVLTTAIAGWAVVTAVRRLAPNDSFKPNPLRSTSNMAG